MSRLLPLFLALLWAAGPALGQKLKDKTRPANDAVQCPYTGGDAELLAAAAQGNDISVAGILGRGGACDVNCLGEAGTTPLLAAVEGGHGSVVEMLLRHPRVDVNRAGAKGLTPLHVAVQSGRKACTKLLLQHAAIAVNVTDADGATGAAAAKRRGAAAAAPSAPAPPMEWPVTLAVPRQPASLKKLKALVKRLTRFLKRSSLTT